MPRVRARAAACVPQVRPRPAAYVDNQTMSNASVNIHPRKLYEVVRACPSPETRIKAAFQFLVGTSGTSHAAMFMQRGGELVQVASLPDQTQVPGMAEEAKRAWTVELKAQSDDDRTKTVDIRALESMPQPAASPTWQAPNGMSFERTFLNVYRDGGMAAVGLFLWKPAELAAMPTIRRAHVDALCNAFVDAGEASVTPR